MAVANPADAGAKTYRESSMSDEAFQAINCFYDGIDHLVRELAEQIAVEEGSFLGPDQNVVAIELKHVQRAAQLVVKSLEQMIDQQKFPESMRRLLTEMADCASHP